MNNDVAKKIGRYAAGTWNRPRSKLQKRRSTKAIRVHRSAEVKEILAH